MPDAPLDRTRWPEVGDEVLYHHGDDRGWTPAVVLAIAQHDGDLTLDVGDDAPVLDVKHRPEPWGWLFYDEAAALTTPQAPEGCTCYSGAHHWPFNFRCALLSKTPAQGGAR